MECQNQCVTDPHLWCPTSITHQTFVAIVQPLPGHLGNKVQAVFGSSGVLAPGMEARILREDGTDTNLNEPGELWLRGANVTAGYWKNDGVNKAFFKDGWLRTGDMFRVDENGNFWFGDRIKVVVFHLHPLLDY